jgi:hypothetical protein
MPRASQLLAYPSPRRVHPDFPVKDNGFFLEKKFDFPHVSEGQYPLAAKFPVV